MSEFRLQIVYEDGAMLRGEPGRGGAFEIDLRGAIRSAILSRGVGLFRSEASVSKAIEEGIEEALMGLKSRARLVAMKR